MDTGWNLVLALHRLARAFFVGGQLMLAVAVVPVERSAPDRERLRAMARRFGWGTLAALAVLIATGAAMAGHFDKWGDSELHLKLALVALVAVLVAWHMRRPQQHVLEAAIFVISLAIVWLGVLVAR
jgi:uncharacterized membrane protein